MGRMELIDLNCQEGPGCGQNGVKGLSHQKGPTCKCGLSI